MNRALQVVSGVSVVFTTLGFGHIMFHDTVHMVTGHGEGGLFVAVHTIVAAALVVLSLIGGYFLLTTRAKQNPQ